MDAKKVLGQPLTLPSGEVLPNRLAKAAMSEGLSDPRGHATDALIGLYQRWAEGGIGLQITGNVQVDARHLERPGNVIVAGPQSAEAMNVLKAWAKASRSRGAGLWMQLAHAGRQTPRIVNRHPNAPSAVAMQYAVSIVGLARPLCTDFDGPARLLREGGALDRPESRLRLGPGWFGPQSPFKLMKTANGFAVMSWYFQQLRSVNAAQGVLAAFLSERKAARAWLVEARRAQTLES